MSSVHRVVKDQHATELAETVGPEVVLGLARERKRLIQGSESLGACAPSLLGKKTRGHRVKGMSVTGISRHPC